MFAVVDDARARFDGRQFNCLVEQNFVINDSFVLNAAVGADDHLWLAQKFTSHSVTIVDLTSCHTKLLIKVKNRFRTYDA